MKRRVTSTEALYLAVEKSIGSFNMLRVMIGKFTDWEGEIDRIRDHWNAVCLKHPQFLFVLKGNYWVEPKVGLSPGIEVVNEPLDLTRIPRLKPLDYHQSAIRLWVFENGLVFQAAHALTDGMGLQNLIVDFFNELNESGSEPLFNAQMVIETEDSQSIHSSANGWDGDYGAFMTEREFALRYIKKPRGFLPKVDKRFRVQSERPNLSFRKQASWIYHQAEIGQTLSGITEKQLLAKMIVTTSQWMQQIHPNSSVRCMVPVDLRKYEPSLPMDGNLSLPLWLELKGNESVDEVSKDLRNRIKQKEPLYNAERFPMEFVGMGYIKKAIFLCLTRWGHFTKRYPISLIVSFMGKHDPNKYGFDGFRCDTVWSTAVYSGICPMQLNVTFDEKHINLCISYHNQLFTTQQFGELLELLTRPSDVG